MKARVTLTEEDIYLISHAMDILASDYQYTDNEESVNKEIEKLMEKIMRNTK